MNYYNPYFYTMPTSVATPKVGLFSRMLGGNKITLGGILNGTQRVLSFANQAIPLVKEVRPMIGNAKTMFKVMNEFKRAEKPKSNNDSINENTIINNNVNDTKQETEIIEQTNESTKKIINNDNGPTFFM